MKQMLGKKTWQPRMVLQTQMLQKHVMQQQANLQSPAIRSREYLPSAGAIWS